MVTWLLAGFGVSVVAGFGVASRIESVVSMVVIGISTSVVPLVGQNWGAHKFDRVNEALRSCYQAVLVWGIDRRRHHVDLCTGLRAFHQR